MVDHHPNHVADHINLCQYQVLELLSELFHAVGHNEIVQKITQEEIVRTPL